MTFVNGFVSGGPQRLDPQDRARAVIKLYYLQEERKEIVRKLIFYFLPRCNNIAGVLFHGLTVAADSNFFSFFTIENDCWDVALSNVLSGRRHPEEVYKAL